MFWILEFRFEIMIRVKSYILGQIYRPNITFLVSSLHGRYKVHIFIFKILSHCHNDNKVTHKLTEVRKRSIILIDN